MIFSVVTVNLINMLFIAAGIGICGLCFLQITEERMLDALNGVKDAEPEGSAQGHAPGGGRLREGRGAV